MNVGLLVRHLASKGNESAKSVGREGGSPSAKRAPVSTYNYILILHKSLRNIADLIGLTTPRSQLKCFGTDST